MVRTVAAARFRVPAIGPEGGFRLGDGVGRRAFTGSSMAHATVFRFRDCLTGVFRWHGMGDLVAS
ncbi:hypothetical protein, partial [Sinorhizobium medicae]|uniref:hypothetical protein n=1 Tax=Sinorhizobium medicae TaxID=110321 RepID=UPI001AEDCDC3